MPHNYNKMKTACWVASQSTGFCPQPITFLYSFKTQSSKLRVNKSTNKMQTNQLHAGVSKQVMLHNNDSNKNITGFTFLFVLDPRWGIKFKKAKFKIIFELNKENIFEAQNYIFKPKVRKWNIFTVFFELCQVELFHLPVLTQFTKLVTYMIGNSRNFFLLQEPILPKCI